MYCLCIFSIRGRDKQVSEGGSSKESDGKAQKADERERHTLPLSPKDIRSVNSTGRFSIPSAFSFLRAEQIAKGTT